MPRTLLVYPDPDTVVQLTEEEMQSLGLKIADWIELSQCLVALGGDQYRVIEVVEFE